MKYLGTICSVLLFSTLAFAQGIWNSGAYIVTTGAAQIYVAGVASTGNYLSSGGGTITPSAGAVITIEGDWINNAGNTGFTADAGTVILNGSTQNIVGTASTTFYNLTLQGSGTKRLVVNTSVGGVTTTTGILSLGSRPLDLNSRLLTITNSATSAVTFTSGYVLSETNNGFNPSKMLWKTGAFTGTYIYPFGTIGGFQIPLTVNKTVATTADITIATRPTATSNNVPWSGMVSHMYDPNLAQDGSDEAVIDRWWDISSTVNVSANVTFSYLGAENTLTVPYNTGNLGAQYWDNGLSSWFPDNSTIGSTPAVLAGVGSHTANGLTLTAGFPTGPWILSSVLAPLPIELISLTANCNENQEIITWSTATELNNDFFTVERSDDGMSFRSVGTVNGSGTTTQIHTYSFADSEPVSGNVYYRLKQTDFNGHTTNSGIITAEICASDVEFIDAFSNGPGINIVMDLNHETDYAVSVFDARGRLVIDQNITAAEGSTTFLLNSTVPATGIYLVNLKGSNGKVFSKRLFISVE